MNENNTVIFLNQNDENNYNYNYNCNYELKNNDKTKILFINNLLFMPNEHIEFDYIMTDNINTFLRLRTDDNYFGKCIFTCDDYKIQIYCCSAKIKKILNNNTNFVNDINKANIVLYDDVSELYDCDNLSKKTIILFDKENTYEILQKINNICRIINNCQKIKKDDIVKFIQNISVQMNKIQINYLNYNNKITLIRNEVYFIYRNGFNFRRKYDMKTLNSFLIDNYVYGFSCVSYIISGSQDIEPLIVIRPENNMNISYLEILEMVEINNDITVGINNNIMNDEEIINYYYLLSLVQNLFGNNYIYELIKNESYYVDVIYNFRFKKENINNKKYDRNKFIRICSYIIGTENYPIDVQKIITYSNNKKIFNTKKIALLTKRLNSYGGNQKTTIQIYDMLIRNGYFVNIICIEENNPINKIHNNDIKTCPEEKLVELINNNYDIVIINKLNQYLNIKDKINIKNIAITHNLLDPFNLNLKGISKLLTVNYDTISFLYQKESEFAMGKHINYVETIPNYKKQHKKFSNKVVFVGRFSKEKNIDLLLEAWNKVIKINNQLQLIIIGDGNYYDLDCYKKENVIFYGKLDFEMILCVLFNSDYLILPSYTEGMPFCILEAMSIGIPVISTNIIGCNEVIIDGVTGFLSNLYGYNKLKCNITANWSILDVLRDNKELHVDNLVNVIIKAYNIPFDEWKKISNAFYELVRNNYNYDISCRNLLGNIISDNNILIIESDHVHDYENMINYSQKIFDIRNTICEEDYNKYRIIVSIKNYKKYEQFTFLSRLYLINRDCENNQINKLVDNNNNFIVFNNKFVKILNIKSFDELFV